MATRRGIAPHDAELRAGDVAYAEARALTAEETAWLLLMPALALSLAAIILLGPPVGRLAFTGTHYTYWPSAAAVELFPKPTELARFVLVVACALGFALAIPLAAGRQLRLGRTQVRISLGIVQTVTAVALAFFFVKQRDVFPYKIDDPSYFTPLAVLLACIFGVATTAALTRPRAVRRLRAATRTTRWSIACWAAAILATVAWLLPSIFTDANILFAQPSVGEHLQFGFDEAMSVLDGRSPLVNMATYGALVPYVVAPLLAIFHGSLAAYSTSMVALTALALLAIFAILRRLAGSAPAALALYVPFLSTSLFIVRGESVERFTFSSYAGMFPIRYAGPYVLAYLVCRHLDGDRTRSAVPLFAAAGLVMLNNTDFGIPALGATLLALTCARPPRSRRALAALAGRAAAGLAIAYALVALLTLLRAGSLPHLDRLFAYARLFGVAGYGNLPTPLLGFHLVILATFVAAAAMATARAAAGEHDVTLTGMLAWCSVFGLGTGAYFVYRSHPDTLIASFSIWSLTLAVLLIVVARAAVERGSLAPTLPLLALLVGFGLAVCSIAQFPTPWLQIERIAETSDVQPLKRPEEADLVRSFTRRGETVAILTPIGHRLAYDTHVTNVMAYTGMRQMPTVEQLRETIDALRAGGGRMIFLGSPYPPEILTALQADFTSVAIDPGSGLIAWRDRQ
jgi:hypothetical protein